MKRVLFIAYLFPPIANSGTQRPLKFAKYLADYGWQPIVMTAAHFEGYPIDRGLLSDLPAEVPLVRVPMLNERVGDTIVRLAGGSNLGRRIGNAVSWRILVRHGAPDVYAWWKRTATREALRLFAADGFDAIYATGFPWTSLLIGRDVSKATGVPLIADFRDLWSGEHLFRDERPPREEELALENSVLEQATTVVTASATIGRHLATAHPSIDEDKFVPIHNGFDAADFSAPRSPEAKSKFRIVFTGVWKDGYNPAELYDTIDWIRRSRPRLLDGVEVITAGYAPGEAQRRHLEQYIDERGVVSHDEAVALMRSADLLYLSHVDPDRQWVVPGKIYEYLASESPVLALTYPEKETAQIIDAVGGGVALSPQDPGTLYEALSAALETKTVVVPPRNPEALACFERRQLTAKLAALLDGATSRVQVVRYTTFNIRADSPAGSPTRSS